MRRKRDTTLTPGPSPATRERGGQQGRGEGRPRPTEVIRGAARQLRKQPTHSEGILWSALRNRGLGGRKFRRQHPVGRFILDFYCHDERLAIEVDGPIHYRQRRRDSERQQALEFGGIRFLRLPAGLVETDLPAALAMIERALTPGPSPALRERGNPQGRGEG